MCSEDDQCEQHVNNKVEMKKVCSTQSKSKIVILIKII